MINNFKHIENTLFQLFQVFFSYGYIYKNVVWTEKKCFKNILITKNSARLTKS